MSTAQTKTSTTSGSGRRKFTPRPPRSAGERLPRLYRGLTDQVDEGHFANAIKTCKKSGSYSLGQNIGVLTSVLNLDPKAETAFQTLLFLHLQTDDYASALALLDNPPSGTTLDFERAYCLYRLHREQEALEILSKISSKGRKEEHLEAQIVRSFPAPAVLYLFQQYRIGDYQKAQEIYDKLLASCSAVSFFHHSRVSAYISLRLSTRISLRISLLRLPT